MGMLQVDVYDSDGDRIDYCIFEADNISRKIDSYWTLDLKTGTYYIKVANYGSYHYSGSYSMSVKEN